MIVVLTGIFSLMYVPSRHVVWDNPPSSLQNIQDLNHLFRRGTVAESFCFTTFLLLPLVVYKLLVKVNPYYAVAMVALAAPSVPILFTNLSNKFAILEVLENGNPVTGQLPNQIMFYLHQFNNGNLIGQNFWALWLLIMGARECPGIISRQ